MRIKSYKCKTIWCTNKKAKKRLYCNKCRSRLYRERYPNKYLKIKNKIVEKRKYKIKFMQPEHDKKTEEEYNKKLKDNSSVLKEFPTLEDIMFKNKSAIRIDKRKKNYKFKNK